MGRQTLSRLTIPTPQMILGLSFAAIASVILQRMTPKSTFSDSDPFYSPRPLATYTPEPLFDVGFPVGRACVKVVSLSPTSCKIQLTPVISHEVSSRMRSLFANLIPRTGGPSIASAALDDSKSYKSLLYFVQNLSPTTDYTVNLYAKIGTSDSDRLIHLCSYMITTHSNGKNLLQNPSFEESAPAPYLPSRPKADNSGFSARHWTPFYNGGARRFCERTSVSETHYVHPHSGHCMLVMARLSTDWHWPRSTRYFGAHQAVPMTDTSTFVVSLWYIHLHYKSFKSAASIVVSWVLADGSVSDGSSVPLVAREDWTPVCLLVQSEFLVRMAHIFIHLENDEMQEAELTLSSKLFVDDVAVWIPQKSETLTQCYKTQTARSVPRPREEPTRHLISRVRPAAEELTAAIPLTADRVLRLETLSRHLGGGTVVAAVAVRTLEEVLMFRKIWQAKRWLREHVDVMFVRRTDNDPLAINALRNIAVSLANTTFVIVLDVDMAPGSHPYDCMRSGDALHSLLPPGKRRVLTMNTFFSGVHQRPARDKAELLHVLRNDAGSAYCAGSQKAGRLKTWFWEQNGRRTRFQKDFEPYVIARRYGYPEFDERFRGYGFNKIAWTVTVEYAGWEMFTLPEAFVTHLNHVENSWVSSIDNAYYIQTWRRFLAFVADMADARRDAYDLAQTINVENK